MFTVKPPESKSNKNEARMHFTWSLAVLGTFKLLIKGLCEIIIVSSSPKRVMFSGLYNSFNSLRFEHW
jgi:hypothetical protein